MTPAGSPAEEDRTPAHRAPGVRPKFLCIVGIARTGTNYLCDQLRQIAEIRSRTEIFHRQEAFGLTDAEIAAVGAAARQRFEHGRDAALIAWMREHPGSAIEAVHSAGPRESILSFKIFREHLPVEAVRESFLTRNDVVFLIVRRQIIDSYISLRKAQTVASFTTNDTTDVRVRLHPATFAKYVRTNQQWYEAISTELISSARPSARLNYEDFAHLPPGDIAGQLVTVLEGLCGTRFSLRSNTGSQFRKQDRAESYEQKVSNWNQFLDHPAVRDLDLDIFGYF